MKPAAGQQQPGIPTPPPQGALDEAQPAEGNQKLDGAPTLTPSEPSCAGDGRVADFLGCPTQPSDTEQGAAEAPWAAVEAQDDGATAPGVSLS